jgi:hypothetical protein
MKIVLAWILAFLIYILGYICLFEERRMHMADRPYLWLFLYVFGVVTILYPAFWYWYDKMQKLFKVGKWKP